MFSSARASRGPLIGLAALILAATALVVALTGGSSGPQAAVASPIARVAKGVLGSGGPLEPFLRFGGQGTVKVHPDTATINFSTEGRGATAAAATDASSADMQKLLDRLAAAGIAKADLNLNGVSTYRAYDKTQEYVATQSVGVTVRDLAKAGQIASDGLSAGAASVDGPNFGLEDQKQAYRAALAAAITDARTKADAAAAAIGAHVTGVVSVDETGGSPVPIMAAAGAADRKSSATVPVPTQPSDQQIGAQVTVVFRYAAG